MGVIPYGLLAKLRRYPDDPDELGGGGTGPAGPQGPQGEPGPAGPAGEPALLMVPWGDFITLDDVIPAFAEVLAAADTETTQDNLLVEFAASQVMADQDIIFNVAGYTGSAVAVIQAPTERSIFFKAYLPLGAGTHDLSLHASLGGAGSGYIQGQGYFRVSYA